MLNNSKFKTNFTGNEMIKKNCKWTHVKLQKVSNKYKNAVEKH